jgi:heat shock protein HslJ
MKMLRYVILLSLATMLLAGCGALPPVFSNAAGPTAAIALTIEPAVPEPAATEAAPAGTAPEPVVTEVATVEPAPTAPAEQTAATPAATEPAAEPQVTPAPDQVMGANPLAGTVWEWAALIKTRPPAQSVVPNPASYTVIFGANGEMLIKADCNNARATYTLENETLAIALGPVTRAACPPGSLSAEFLTNLSKVGSYLIDGSDLVLRLAETNDSMIFRNGGPSAEPAPPPAVATEAPAGAPAEAATPELVGPTWQWESFFDVATGNGTFDVANPANYTVTFLNDGTVTMQADCNRAAGTSTVNGASLTVVVGPVTLAACGPESRGADFLINLTSAGTHMFVDGKLAIDLQADGGRMIFRAAQ